jgi:hypothetical protein
MYTNRHRFLWLSFVSVVWVLLESSAFCQDRITLPCEVMESSDAFRTSSAKLEGVHYLLLHHANSVDR